MPNDFLNALDKTVQQPQQTPKPAVSPQQSQQVDAFFQNVDAQAQAQQQNIKYPDKPNSVTDQIAALPQSDKLTGFERWVYQRLPGFSQSTAGKALQAFSESPAGKLLGLLDVPAEGIERSLGVLSQLTSKDPNEDFNLKDAWAAGSMFYDTVQLPEFYRDQNGALRLRLDQDMPGNMALAEARKLLDSGKTLAEVKDVMYGNMGALALRSQLRDTVGHIVADPLNWVLGAVKPVEKLHALRNLALTTKMDVEEASKVATLLRNTGKVEDAVKVEQAIQKAQETGKALTRADKFVITLTGGEKYTEDATKLEKIFRSKVNPFALTPQARAQELLDVVNANVVENIIRPNWGKDPEEIINVIKSAANGSIGGEWGHLAQTIQGRTVQSYLKSTDAAMTKLGKEWELYKNERGILDAVSRATGQHPELLADLARKNPTAFTQKVAEAIAGANGAELQALMKEGKLTDAVLGSISKIPATAALSKEKFYTSALIDIQDVAMKQAILQFGVKEKSLMTKWADAVKAWETLPFIKINPANAMRNMLNNEVTLLGRGLQGVFNPEKYWKELGGPMPEVLKRSFNIAGEELSSASGDLEKLLTVPSKAEKTLGKTLTGEVGLADKVKQAAQVDLGPAKFISEWSAASEKGASARAVTKGWIEFHNQYWNPKTGFTSISKYLDGDTLDEIAKIDPNLARTLDEVAQSTQANPQKFAKMMETSLDHNPTTVFKNAEDRLGFKLDDVLGPELTQRIADGLPAALEKGNVKEFISGLRKEMEAHVDEMFNKHVQELPGIVKAQVQAGGPMQFHRIFGKAMDEFWAGNTEHAIRMSTLNDLMDYAKQTGNYEKAGEMWSQVLQDSESHFNRIWKKMDAYQSGLEEGAKAAGITYPTEVRKSFKGMENGWKDFFEFRNKEYSAFFDAQKAGKPYAKTLEDIQNEVSFRYNQMAKNEDKLYQAIDDGMAKAIPDKQMQQIYTNYRDTVAQLRTADREATTAFYDQLRQADTKDAPDMWARFWKEKQARAEQIRQMDLQGSAAIQGDPNAIQQFMAPQAGQASDNIYGLASQYGIPSANRNGVRNDRRILATINKYTSQTDVTGAQLVQNAVLPDEVKSTFAAMDQAHVALEEARAANSAAIGTEGAQSAKEALANAKKAAKDAADAYEKALQTNNIDKKMINKLVNNKEFMDPNTVPLDVAKQAFEARAQEKGAQIAQNMAEKGFIPDAEQIFKDPMPVETAISELNYGRSYAAMDAIAEEATAQAGVKSQKLTDLPEGLQKKVMQWYQNVQDESSGFRSAATQYAQFRRDSALLNYNRRTNFDTWAGNIFPFAFWTTHSAANWALHSIDRPAMLTTYLRMKKMFETSGLPDQNVPTRLKGQIRWGKMPFAPDWMGDAYIDPMAMALPFDSWLGIPERMQSQKLTLDGKTQSTLQDMLDKGTITEAQYNDAINNKSGDAWNMAKQVAQDGGDNYNAMDFVNMMSTPHAPLMWAYNIARGQPNDIGPFTPMARTARNFATLFGVKDWQNSSYNLSGRLRKEMGLPAYDKWDDYRIAREVSNMATEGKYSMDEIKQAMQVSALVESGQMDPEEAKKNSKVYEEAIYRSNQEYAGGPVGTILGTLGIPFKAFPEGEVKQRELADQFSAAYKEYQNGNVDALTKFFDDHPEYESRLSLFKKPEERLQNFMVDNLWSRWNELPKVTQNEVKDQLGPNFANNFLNKDTRSYESLTPDQMNIWLKLMGGKTVGKMSATNEALAEFNQLKLTDPETAWRTQTFFDGRNAMYPDWSKLQNAYYALPEGPARQKFSAENKQLKQYWDYRRSWMQKNPDLVRFLTDDPKQLKKFENVQRNPQVAAPTAQEISRNLSPANMELIQQWANGQSLPQSTDKYLEMIASQYGIPKRDLLGILTGK